MLKDLTPSLKTRSPLQIFTVFAVGIILPGGFLSFLGLRSFQYESMLMKKQTEERYSAVADLMEKKAGEKLMSLVDALRTVARDENVQNLNVPGLMPLVVSPPKLADLPVNHLYVFDEEERLIAPPPAGRESVSDEETSHELDWGGLRDTMDRLDHKEFVEKDIKGAVDGYLSLQSRNLSASHQAALLKNIAGGYRKLHNSREAEAAYLKLIRSYDQLVDVSGLPMGVLARQLLIKLYDDEKARDRALETRLDLYEGLLLRRWRLGASQQKRLMDELKSSISASSGGDRWNRLVILQNKLAGLEIEAQVFENKKWPDLVKRLRLRGWREQGGVIQMPDEGSEKQVAVIAPLLWPHSERPRGMMVAVVPGALVWPQIEQSLAELAKPVGLQVYGDYLTASHDAPKKLAGALWKPTLERPIEFIDPPIHFSLLELNSQDHDHLFRRRLWIYGGMIGLSLIVIIVGLVVMREAVRREMEVANLKADFVANVSHELRTPLTAISYIAERLSLNRVRSENERQEFHDMLGQETHRLRSLIEDVLDFSKALAGKKVYQRETLDAAALVQEAYDHFHGKAAAGGFSVELQLPKEPILILGDRRALLQAILNLLNNALKYSGESRRIALSLTAKTDRAVIAVQDYGIGIPKAEQERIFEKFYRVERSLTRETEGGVGLGLAMVKHIVEGHQGTIRVESQPGQGSLFALEFPLVKE